MSRPTIAEQGFLGDIIDDCLRPALQSAESTLSDLENLERCDAPGCNRLFDKTDPRCGRFYSDNKIEHFYCPGCEIEAKAADPSPPHEKAQP